MKSDIESLIRRAFQVAKEKGKPEWRRMSLSVLKNRLLDLTEREFSEREYGASSLDDFARKFPDLLAIDPTTVPVSVVLKQDTEQPGDVGKSHPTVPDVLQRNGAPETISTERDWLDAEQALQHGDLLVYGEILASNLGSIDAEERLARVTSAWAATARRRTVYSDLSALLAAIDDFHEDDLAKAVVAVFERLSEQSVEAPRIYRDLAFRVADRIASLFEVRDRRTEKLCATAGSRLGSLRSRLINEVGVFASTNAATAKQASIGVVRVAKSYRDVCIAGEWPLLRTLETVLGATFRKFCEAYETHDVPTFFRRTDDLRHQIATVSSTESETGRRSRLWLEVVNPVLSHVSELIARAVQRVDSTTAPVLGIADKLVKLDLKSTTTMTQLVCRLRNSGQGRATNVSVDVMHSDERHRLELVAPSLPFDIEGNAERLVTFLFESRSESDEASIALRWTCASQAGRVLSFDDEIHVQQQAGEPIWEALIASPPYTLNPVRRREQLYGRDSVLTDLLLNSNSQTSTFLWGAKRVGKTSVLQVLANELTSTDRVACIIFRMGEIGAMHEGEIAFVLAERLSHHFSLEKAPREDEFGAGLRRLIPFVERLPIHSTGPRPVIVIDEFDDLDPAFYSGERGRQFVKALRSLSEAGLTFFFVGSERMDAIYRRHAADLNKWVNVHLDRIESRDDCRAVITAPVRGAIEFDAAAVDFLIGYCGGNPFYLNVVCMELFKRCAQERRTYVGMGDVQAVRRQLLRTLGASNFSHFWEDNPELEIADRERQAAENALVLACLVQGGGDFESVDDVEAQQVTLGLRGSQGITRSAIERAIARLKHRGVIRLWSDDGNRPPSVGPPIFLEWVTEQSELLLEVWRNFQRLLTKNSDAGAATIVVSDHLGAFPVSEDDLIAVTQSLVYLGKQKDVAEVRSWLRQFDDESRIEVAYLLLKRLAERGYISEGNQSRNIAVVEEAVNKRRLEIGERVWRMARQRRDNLCVAFVDSETKSGATVARELAKRMRPAKVGRVDDVAVWLRNRAQLDPLLVIVDDFAATGSTLLKGLRPLEKLLVGSLASFREGRVMCYVQYAFPEALDVVRADFPWLEVVGLEVFSEELRALDPEANIFESEGELMFAKDVLLQIGRELQPQAPFGFGDVGALVTFHNTIPNNTLPVFWCAGTVNDKAWKPLFQRA